MSKRKRQTHSNKGAKTGSRSVTRSEDIEDDVDDEDIEDEDEDTEDEDVEIVDEEVVLSPESQKQIAAIVIKGLAPMFADTAKSTKKDKALLKGVTGGQADNEGDADNEDTMGKSFGTNFSSKRIESEGPAIRLLKSARAMINKEKDVVREYNAFALEQRQKEFDNATDAVQKANWANSGEPADGGYLLLEPEVEKEISRLEAQYGVALQEADVRTIQANEIKVTLGLDNVSLYATTEGQRKTGTKATYGQKSVELRKWAGIAAVTDELVDDAAIDFWRDLTNGFARARAQKADEIVFTEDDGANSHFGILNTPGVEAVSVDASTIANIEWDDLFDAEAKLLPESLVGAKWFMHRSIWNVLRKKRGSTNDGYLFPTMLADGKRITPNGYEVVLTEVLRPSNAGLNNQPYLVFGNLKNDTLYTKGGLQLDFSNEATVYDTNGDAIDLFAQDMTALRAVTRMEHIVKQPKNFVVLGAGTVS